MMNPAAKGLFGNIAACVGRLVKGYRPRRLDVRP